MKRREVESVAFYKGKKVLPGHLQLAGRRLASPQKPQTRISKNRQPLKRR